MASGLCGSCEVECCELFWKRCLTRLAGGNMLRPLPSRVRGYHHHTLSRPLDGTRPPRLAGNFTIGGMHE